MEATSNPYQTPTSNMDTASGNTAHTKPISMSGRISRMRYLGWLFAMSLVSGLAFTLVFMIAMAFGAAGAASAANSSELQSLLNGPFFFVFALIGIAIIIPVIILSIGWGRRRLNDCNKSGWLLLLLLIPLINIILGIYMMAAPGTPGDNNYGPPTPKNSTAVTILGSIYLILMIGSIAFDVFMGVAGFGLQGSSY